MSHILIYTASGRREYINKDRIVHATYLEATDEYGVDALEVVMAAPDLPTAGGMTYYRQHFYGSDAQAIERVLFCGRVNHNPRDPRPTHMPRTNGGPL